MKALLVAAFLAAATLHASDYVKDYADLKGKVGEGSMEKHLSDWRKREPDNPDALILSANWELEQADGSAVRGDDGKALPKGNYKLEMRGDKVVVIGANGKPASDIVPDRSQAGIVKAA